jgi:hypothetical protein
MLKYILLTFIITISLFPQQLRKMPNFITEQSAPGTAWLPEEAPLYGFMFTPGAWSMLLQGNIYLRYNNQDIRDAGIRGGERYDAPTWFMLSAFNRLSANTNFRFNLLLSLDPFVMGNSGYPFLFQSGQTWEGYPLVDRQHPRDLFSEISLNLTHSFSRDLAGNIYFGFPGEPALGPASYMFRPSSRNNPNPPLSHYWHASPAAGGAATLGLQFKRSKIEGSVFSGREADEDRYLFDNARFDSYSLRLSTRLSRSLVLQASGAKIKSPYALRPDVDVTRTTASAVYGTRLSRKLFINSSLVWGYNYEDEDSDRHSFLFESDFIIDRFSFLMRYDYVQKSHNDLELVEFPGEVFSVSAFTIGTSYLVITLMNLNASVGFQGTVFFPDEQIRFIYGSKPISVEAFIRISPHLLF